MADRDKNARQSLLEDMKTTAHSGNLVQLQRQLSKWDTEVTGGRRAVSGDSLWNRPTAVYELGILHEMSRPREETRRIPAGWHDLQEILIAASQGDQAAVVRFMITERDCSITPVAIEQAMKAKAFHVLEVFLEHGWDINQPIRNNLCSILRQVVHNEDQVRWCLEHGADPNARNRSKIMDVPSYAARIAPFPVLLLLLSYGADFRNSNSLHCAARGGRVDVMQWLLEEQRFPINKREFEYDTELFEDRCSNKLGTALHVAVEGNSVKGARFLLEQGIDAEMPDSVGNTPLQRARVYGRQEMISLLENLPT